MSGRSEGSKTRMNRLSITVAVLFAGYSTSANAAPQTFNTALPVAKGEFVYRGQLFERRASGDPGAADRDLRVRGAVSVLGRGVARNWVVFGVLPYVDKSLDLDTPGGRAQRSVTGVADARLFARYTLYQSNAKGRTFRIAPFFGAEIPTGEDDEEDSLGPLPPPLQLGSGSWDPFAGVVLTYQTLDYQIDVQVGYKHNTEANDFQFGDEARLDASFQYRLWPRVLEEEGVPGYLYGVIECNVVHYRKNEAGGLRDPNSGGASLFLSPGVQYVTRRWILEGIVQVPITQNPGGTALEDDYTVRVGIRFNF